MAIKTYRQGFEHTNATVKEIVIEAERVYRVRWDDNGTERIDKFDLSGYENDEHPLYGADMGSEYNEVIQMFETFPAVQFNLWGQPHVEDTIEEVSTYPHTLFLAKRETAGSATATRTYTASGLSDAEKLTLFKEAYSDIWIPQKKQWLREAPEFIDLSFDILRRGGLVLKAASYALHQMALDTTIDKAHLAKGVQLMALGATDVRTAAEFAVYLNNSGQYFPDGPVKPRNASGIPTPGQTHVPVGVLWVAENASGEWERVASTAVVFKDDYEVPSSYNPNDLSWLDSL